MEGLPWGITPQSGVAGLILAVLALVIGASLRRYDRGSAEAMAGLSGLNDRLVKDAATWRQERDDAQAELDMLRSRFIRLDEYSRQLEERLGIPHRHWGET